MPFIAEPTNNLQAVCNRFVYLPPPSNASKAQLFDWVILVEKLGHYKFAEGGCNGTAGSAGVGWSSPNEYKTLAEKNGISIEQLTEPKK